MKESVLITGNFNILHSGHLRLFRYAKELAKKLYVGVNSEDRSTNKVVAQNIRIENLKSINLIDKVIVIDKSIKKLIEDIKPDIVLKGKEHEKKNNIEKSIIEKYGGKLIFGSGEIFIKTSDLVKNKSNPKYNKFTTNISADFLKRNKIKLDSDIIAIIKKFKNLKTLVIGDLIIDEYIESIPLGMSQEDPTIVVSPFSSNKFVGGAGIVAAHASNLGSKVDFISVCGDDELYEYAKIELKKNNVKTFLIKDFSRPTTLKKRYRAKNKTLLRVSHLNQSMIEKHIQAKILKIIKEKIDNYNLVVFSDFNYGCLPENLIKKITDLCISKNIYVVADCQSSSQIGDISKYKNTYLITPTEREARLAMKDNQSGLIVLCQNILKKTKSKNIFLKLGEEGVIIYSSDGSKSKTDSVSALNPSAKDVAGAGDSMLISSGLSIAAGADIWTSSLIGSIAAAIQVSKTGNLPITSYDILNQL